MRELGTTNDPKALVPGDAGTLNDIVQMLGSYGDMLAEAASGLQRIDTSDGWAVPRRTGSARHSTANPANGSRQAVASTRQPRLWTATSPP
jgi:hypothetical protein